MTETFVLNTTVAYADVDRTESLALPGVFKLLQEAAILHANEFGTGTDSLATRGETWLLNRIAAGIARYPRFGERLRIETWSRGIRGFKGLRDTRIRDETGQVLVAASSLWIYVSARTKSIARVPRELAARVPVGRDDAHCPTLEALEFAQPGPDADRVAMTLRYSDFDVNDHVNNTAYLDLLQTALAQTRRRVQPQRVTVKFARPIALGTDDIVVRLAEQDRATLFCVESGGTPRAQGSVA